MRNFMGKDAGQLRFIFDKVDQPLIDIDITPRRGKCVDRGAPDNGKLKIKRRFFTGGKNPSAQTRKVAVDLFVLQKEITFLQFFVEFLSQFFFIFYRKGCLGRRR